MSILKQLKNAEARIEELAASIAGKDEALTAAQQAIADRDQQIEKLTADHAVEVATLATELASVKELSEAQAGELQKLRDEKTEIEAAAGKLQRAVESDPAFAQAASEGVAAIAGDTPAPEGEKRSLIDQMEAITDPQERRAFYLKNKQAIKAEVKKGA
jgi:peptidoglycan hydrolase CwlO-like protein